MPARNEMPPATGRSSATGTAPMPERAAHLVVDSARGLVVDADHGAVARLLAVEDVLLGRDIARHVAVPVDMVGRDVEPDRDMGAEGLEQLELIGRQLQHIDAARPERREIERAAADIAADLAAPRRRSFRMWPISAVVVDLPLVPVMPTKRACGLGAGQQLDVADDRLAGGTRRRGHGMRLGQAVRDARADAPAP